MLINSIESKFQQTGAPAHWCLWQQKQTFQDSSAEGLHAVQAPSVATILLIKIMVRSSYTCDQLRLKLKPRGFKTKTKNIYAII